MNIQEMEDFNDPPKKIEDLCFTVRFALIVFIIIIPIIIYLLIT